MGLETKLKCSCGHEGSIWMKENDAPFTKAWERHTLRGFDGRGPYEVSGRFVSLAEVFENLAPVCPECREQISESHITN